MVPATRLETTIVAQLAAKKAFTPSRALAKLLCFIPASYFLAVTAYALFNFSDYAADLPRFLRYVALPGGIAAALIVPAFALSPRKGANIGLCASALLFALLLVEIVLNVRLVVAMMGMVQTLEARDGEGRADVVSGLPPTYTNKHLANDMEIDSLDDAILGGIPWSEVLQCSLDGEPLSYSADRFGFNNWDDIYDKPLQVMMVGDSFVEGHCQPRPDTFAGQMREYRPQTAAIGMRGSGPLYELALIGRFGQELEPDWVAMAFYEGNDWKNLEREAEIPWLSEALLPDADFGSATPTDDQVERAQTVVRSWWNRDVSPGVVFERSSFFRNMLALNQVWRLAGLDYPRIAQDQPVYGDVLVRARELTESWGGQFVLVYIPQGTRYQGAFDKSFAYDDMRDHVLADAEREGIEVVDLTDVFAEIDDPDLLYATDGHFSPYGSEVAAQALNAHIASLKTD
ncbi:alginate O-acetyltransferase AlgX-related protein [Aurantiacibacter poecillastricola]|uniref:alginate O-acetyltransferase AlgX-related protein n=1 Tax=Aurantiacibacter poecillastricola TaxID=3064385 RepID=UPI0027400C54|nr:hypothetical protein [Aurantiacibacter sp. 219JJ12-13]MDP5263164.1 hypothetical protein [Aurantiacibacter sp. 219JJ12-13]